jgi:hypothetical protein
MSRIFCHILFIVYVLFPSNILAQDAYSAYIKMINTIKTIKSLQYDLEFQERMDGKIVYNSAQVKVNEVPFKVYMYQLLPKEGIELLYDASVSSSDVYINPNGIPWFTLTFGVNSNSLRERYRNSIFNIGYSPLVKLDSFLQKKYKAAFPSMINFEPDTKCKDGTSCIVLSINIPDFRYFNYTLKTNEDLISLASKYTISEYMILELNPDIQDYFDVSPGETILIPSDYAKKVVLFIDPRTLLPREIRFFDEKELFQEYRYNNIIKNPAFKGNEFSLENPDYNF